MYSESLVLNDFNYYLPDEKIAKYPLKDRGKSKLLFYDQGEINDRQFDQIIDLLPEKTHLVFNDTKVIPARIILRKETGARIELFLLEPLEPRNAHEAVMASKNKCSWKVMIGNARKWKIGSTLEHKLDDLTFSAYRSSADLVQFSWTGDDTFSEVLTRIGIIPLPPYLNRQATEEDIPRYQTVYSRAEGAVAAPTAGLHFTPQLLGDLQARGFSIDYLTLHVSAGTFQPIKTDSVTEHPMHNEQIIISRQNILQLLGKQKIIPVGTTSMRTLESLYWYGCKLASDHNAAFFIEKLYPYKNQHPLTRKESLNQVLRYMDAHQLDTLTGSTEIFIFPGYKFRICNGLITNFHLPGSTLILLVAALVGPDWKRIYDHALDNEYRFLSYGDSSLLIP